MSRIHGGVVAFVFGLLCGGSTFAHAQDKLRLTLANGVGAGIPTFWWFKEYIGPQLEKYSDGRIRTNVQGNATLCSENKCVEQARLGQIDIGAVGTANIGAFGSTYEILNLPFLLKQDASAERIVNGWLGKELASRAEKEMGLHIFALVPALGYRNIDNSKRVVRKPADLAGLKIRATKSPLEVALLKEWGATAVPYEWTQLYEGLQSGVVDGMYIPDAFVAQGKFFEVTKFITQTEATWNSHVYFLDKKRYDRLPKWAKDIVAKVSDEIRAKSFAIDAEWLAKYNEAMKGKVQFYKPTSAELEQWHAGATAAWVAVKGTYDPALARRILEEQNQRDFIKKLETVKAL
jgi:TRAP-type transport system periplasmic protein